jgi:hypothetical protein
MMTLGSSSNVSPGIWLAVILGGLLVVLSAFGGKADDPQVEKTATSRVIES